MLHINVLCIGKVKESFFKEAIEEYSKRLKKYCIFSIIELPDKSLPNKINNSIEQQIIEYESDSLISKLSNNSYNIALDSHGEQLDSMQFSYLLNDIQQTHSEVTFIIGGSLGLSDKLKNLCNKKISFSKMTFPHQLIRVFLLEQIFRAYKINNNEKYHH